jgi:Fe-S-cluster containining protein
MTHFERLRLVHHQEYAVIRKVKRRSFIPARVRYPHEKRYPWLTILLDSYAILDYEMSETIARSRKAQGVTIACHKGCFECCLEPDVPISQLETMGISWYITEIMDFKTQEQLIPRLQHYRQSLECPLLLGCLCSAYPVRPMACRSLLVYTIPCAEGEDPTVTRPEDIYVPNRSTAKRVVMRFLDCDMYGLTSEKEKEEAFERGIVDEITRPMYTIDWSRLVGLVYKFRRQRTVDRRMTECHKKR